MAEKALAYMGLKPGIPLTEVVSTKCLLVPVLTRVLKIYARSGNRQRAESRARRTSAGGSRSGPVKAQAEAEGLDKIFIEVVLNGACQVVQCVWR